MQFLFIKYVPPSKPLFHHFTEAIGKWLQRYSNWNFQSRAMQSQQQPLIRGQGFLEASSIQLLSSFPIFQFVLQDFRNNWTRAERIFLEAKLGKYYFSSFTNGCFCFLFPSGDCIHFYRKKFWSNIPFAGSGCGAVDRAVASNTRGPGFESSHRQLLLNNYLLFIEKTKNKEKEAGNCLFLKRDPFAAVWQDWAIFEGFWWQIFLQTSPNIWAAAIAPWFFLRLPSCGHEFESQAQHLSFFLLAEPSQDVFQPPHIP